VGTVNKGNRLDERQFESAFRKHGPRVYGICLRLIGDPDRAADAAQSAFIRAWEHRGQFVSGTDLGAWIGRIATTTALNELRSDARRRLERIGDHDYLTANAPTDDTSAGAMAMEAGIASLPSATRSVFVLHDVEGYSTDEIASLAGIAPATVRVHLHRARKILRGLLAP
jgi:RNA polymerase sigma-70 factor (ECF subfamily)